ncbi:MAG TPA: NAD(P)H-binding protein [Pseudonocardiaceae bacterium]|nr:NAD(P)H-binding protein [Pseudonocardiaceae bacterium]
MSTVLIIGGTGYTGANVAAEAATRGHRVTSFSRFAPPTPVAGVTYSHGQAEDATALIDGQDVVVATLSPRGDLAGRLPGLYQDFATAAASTGVRLIVIAGFSSLRPAPGEPRFTEGEIPERFRSEALEMDEIRNWLVTVAPDGLDWTVVSPAGGYGSYAPGERIGRYRVGGEVALFDENGESEISGADFALAVVDEIDRHEHPREHISVAY